MFQFPVTPFYFIDSLFRAPAAHQEGIPSGESVLLLVIGAPKERRVTRVCACGGGRRTYYALSSPVSIWGPASVCESERWSPPPVLLSLFSASVIKKQQKTFWLGALERGNLCFLFFPSSCMQTASSATPMKTLRGSSQRFN